MWLGGTASSAPLATTRVGTETLAALRSPWARDSSTLHCESQLRSVEKRASPTGPSFTMRGSPR